LLLLRLVNTATKMPQ